jgi:glucose/arabinose dehydrogenase
MLNRSRTAAVAVTATLLALAGSLPAQDDKLPPVPPPRETGAKPPAAQPADDTDGVTNQVTAPADLPRIPPPDPRACELPQGYTARVVTTGLNFPTSIEFDDRGVMYVAEAGEAPGADTAPARVLRLHPTGQPGVTRQEVVADQLCSPVNDILWHQGKLYISHRGKISVVERDGKVRDLVTGLPSYGDHTNNQMAAGRDGKIYFGQGSATNSGVVGIDNFLMGWLPKHPTVHDVPGKDITLAEGAGAFESPDLMTIIGKNELQKTKTAAFHAFGKSAENGGKVAGSARANAAILRMDPDGSNLEVFASGIRNPYGLKFGPDGKLYATESALDDRGSRPVANVPDYLWEIKEGAWYGWPDFAGGVPVTDERFKPKKGPAPKFVLKDHPKVEKPVAEFDPHSSATKFDFAPQGPFGDGTIYVAMHGDMCPITGERPADLLSYAVLKLDRDTMKPEPFFRARKDALGPKGFEYVATAGPRRPIAVRFAPRGEAMFVLDFGPIAMLPSALGASPKPFPNTGTVWVILPTTQGVSR